MTTFSRTPPRRLTDAELEQRWLESYPEWSGPGVDTESGAVLYGQPGHPRIGRIEPLLPPEVRDRENREREARWAALTDAERAALTSISREKLRTWI